MSIMMVVTMVILEKTPTIWVKTERYQYHTQIK